MDDIRSHLESLVSSIKSNKDASDVTHQFLEWLFIHDDELDDESKMYSDRVLDTVRKHVEADISTIEDPRKKREAERLLAKAKGERYDVGYFLQALETQPYDPHPVIEQAYQFALTHLQKMLDLLYDLAQIKGQDRIKVDSLALLFGCVDAILASVHLARHNYALQANIQLRSVLETLDMIDLFRMQPQWYDVWIGDDEQKIWRELRPASVRKKLGRDSWDPIYSFLSEVGTHTTLKKVYSSSVDEIREVELPKRIGITRQIYVGGQKLDHVLVYTGFSISFIISLMLVAITKFGEDTLDTKECEDYLSEAGESLAQFLEKQVLPFIEQSRLNTDDFIAAIHNLKQALES